MHTGFRSGLAALLMLATATPAAAQVSGDINISPKRLVFDGASRATTVFIFNRGTAPASYRIDLIDRAMTEDGQIQAVDELAKNSANAALIAKLKSSASMIQYTPRRVTIAPGGTQTVRLRLLRPTELADGEYRTTLTVSTLPPEDVGLTAEQAVQTEKDQLAVKVVSLFGVSIPVIVRQGTHDATATLQEPTLTGSKLRFVITRQGTGSVYGNIEVHRDKLDGAVIGVVKGIGIYGEIDRREMEIPLDAAVAVDAPLFLVYRDDDAEPGKIIASERIARK